MTTMTDPNIEAVRKIRSELVGAIINDIDHGHFDNLLAEIARSCVTRSRALKAGHNLVPGADTLPLVFTASVQANAELSGRPGPAQPAFPQNAGSAMSPGQLHEVLVKSAMGNKVILDHLNDPTMGGFVRAAKQLRMTSGEGLVVCKNALHDTRVVNAAVHHASVQATPTPVVKKPSRPLTPNFIFNGHSYPKKAFYGHEFTHVYDGDLRMFKIVGLGRAMSVVPMSGHGHLYAEGTDITWLKDADRKKWLNKSPIFLPLDDRLIGHIIKERKIDAVNP